MLTILLGILSSVFAEIVTALNKHLQGTVLKGDAAFLVAFGMALVASIVHEVMVPGFQIAMLLNWQTMVATFSEVFAVSQVYFLFIMQKLQLDVNTAPAPVSTTVTTTPPTAVVSTEVG
jgi:cystathionine beta-lyase/cystathionine gamma-synthase